MLRRCLGVWLGQHETSIALVVVATACGVRAYPRVEPEIVHRGRHEAAPCWYLRARSHRQGLSR